MTKPALICPVCGKRTKGRNGLKSHMLDQHSDEREKEIKPDEVMR